MTDVRELFSIVPHRLSIESAILIAVCCTSYTPSFLEERIYNRHYVSLEYLVSLTLRPLPEGDIVIDLDMIFETELLGHEGGDGNGSTMNIHPMARRSSANQQHSRPCMNVDLLSHLFHKEYMTRSPGSSFLDRQYCMDFLVVA